MKELARWASVCICAVASQLGFTLWFLVPYISDHWYSIHWEDRDSSDFGWRSLTPYYAWPILVTYGGALLVLCSAIGVAVGRTITLQERKAIDIRETGVGLQEERIRIDTAKARHAMTDAEGVKQAAREEMARFKQEATAQIEDADARLMGSVGTNMGRQRMIQKLRKRVGELEAENQELRKQFGGPEEAE